MVLVLTMVVLQSISFTNYALTTTTTNIIYGSAPYLTFDGGRTRVTNIEALHWISLSDGRTFTPTTNNSRDNPIELPVAGQSFNDIGMVVPTGMFVPTNYGAYSIELSSLISEPYNYWGDDDGDGQGVNGVTATGRLYLGLENKEGYYVAFNEVLDICKAPYKLILSNGDGTLTTHYGVPNESRFSASNATYYINPKETPAICFARPGSAEQIGLSAAIWNPDKGFLTQSFTPSSYGLNFPTTGANNLFFDLDIVGNNQALFWAPVSHDKITATMTNSTSTSVRVTLTGPIATPSQLNSEYGGGGVDRPSLPQVFELVGRDSSGNAVVKYGFELKRWFVNRGTSRNNYNNIRFWCGSSPRYHLPRVRDLTNAICGGSGTLCIEESTNQPVKGATPSSPGNSFRRHIGAGFFSEWGDMTKYNGANFRRNYYWASDKRTRKHGTLIDIEGHAFMVGSDKGSVVTSIWNRASFAGLCVYP